MKKQKYFGTDGIRGRVGVPPITVDFVLKLGWAIGKLIASEEHNGKVLIGKDTRISGYMIESALQAGLSAAGIDVHRLGVIPTSALAYLTRTLRAHMGIVISASHNIYSDNGIKFFSAEGYKLTNSTELAIEEILEDPIVMSPTTRLGKAFAMNDAQGRYIEFCKSSIPHHTNLKGLKIVLDCANGATYHIAPFVLSELGAEVINLNIKPNGVNINEHCGACHPEEMKQRVLLENADLGISLDGDGDRIIMADHHGEILDGDEILFIIFKGLIDARRFRGGVVGTEMSNMGLEVAVKDLGVNFIRTAVGDQHVIEALLQKKWILGGETSGHIVNFDVTTTGDGIISALQVLQTMYVSEKSLHKLKKEMKKFPQKLINLPYKDKKIALDDVRIKKAVKSIEDKLQEKGRVILRYSGTEPVLRIMVEGEDAASVEKWSDEFAEQLTGFLK